MKFADWREHFTKPTVRKNQDSALDKISAALDDGQKFVIAEVPTGCVDSETIIVASRAKNSNSITIKDEWLLQEGKASIPNRKLRRTDVKTFVRGLISIDRVGSISSEGIVHSGFKRCIKLTSNTGRELILTPEHRVWCGGEWVEARDMLNKLWSVDSPRAVKGKTKSKKMHDTYVGWIPFHPFAQVCNSTRDGKYKKIEKHRAVYEAHLNNMSLECFVHIIKHDEISAKDLVFSSPKNHIHHKDFDHYNNDPQNLEELSPEEHMKKHNEFRVLNFSQGTLALEEVVSIKDAGIREVFDVKNTPSESFTANSVVIHNCGKSDIAVTLAKTCGSAYIATSQNVLIDQYVNDFSADKDFKHVKGAGNYECVDGLGTCRDGVDHECVCSKEGDDGELNVNSTCPYKRRRNKAIYSPIALTNLTYFAVAMTHFSSKWQHRQLSILDESHNLANEVLGLVSVNIYDKVLTEISSMYKIKTFAAFSKYSFKDRVDIADYASFIIKVKSNFDEYIKEHKDDGGDQMNKLIEKLEDVVGKIDYFFESYDNDVEWIITLEEDAYKTISYPKLVARPLHANYFAQKFFFEQQSSQYLMQSATIIDGRMYAKELGIETSKYIVEGSPFDINKNRPVFCMNSGIMTYKEINDSIPKAVKDINLLIACYQGKRGLVHTTSYDNQRKLEEHLKHNKRCLFMTTTNKREMLEKFDETDDAILFSPALTEGFDGKGDKLRFQILLRIPFPSIGDMRIKVKKQLDPAWYIYETKKPIIQSVGRGMRSVDDWCDFYVLDSGFERFVERNMPRDFQDTVVPSRDAALSRASKIYTNRV